MLRASIARISMSSREKPSSRPPATALMILLSGAVDYGPDGVTGMELTQNALAERLFKAYFTDGVCPMGADVLALPLREANAAVAALAGRKSTGKVVLTMDIS